MNIGEKYGRLTVVKEIEGKRSKYRYKYFECKCDCGTTIVTYTRNLSSGNIKSCGCLKKEIDRERFLKHGLRKTKIYSIWKAMRKRCNNANYKEYYLYGGRGIKVCNEWNDYKNFYDDMIGGYSEGLSIDRIDTNGNYCKENCRWADAQQQQNNKRNNKFIEYNGERKTIGQWCRVVNMRHQDLNTRIKNGWSTERALFTPVRHRN